MGSLPGELRDDLIALDPFFNPIRVGRTVREALQRIPPRKVAAEPPYADDLVVVTDDDRRLVTPEGRVVLTCLRLARTGNAITTFDPDSVNRGHFVLLETYRLWSQQRLRRVVQFSSRDKAPMLLPPGLGVLVLLLVNRSTHDSRAIVVPEPEDPRGGSLEQAFSSIVSAYADAIAPSKRGRSVSLYSTYAVSEARRRLPSQLSKNGSRLFISPGHEQHVIDFVVRQLRRRSVPPDLAAAAFDRLLAAYRQALPVLAQFGAAHERPAETVRIRSQIVDALNP